MNILRNGSHRGFALRYGANEVAPGLFEPIAVVRGGAVRERHIEFDRRWVMGLSEAIARAEGEARKWVDSQPSEL